VVCEDVEDLSRGARDVLRAREESRVRKKSEKRIGKRVKL
jgi:hypothetical protein